MLGWGSHLDICVEEIQRGNEIYILLTGKTTCFYHKQVAQEAVIRVIQQTRQPMDVRNEILVVYNGKKMGYNEFP
jgi:hypothetical protein